MLMMLLLMMMMVCLLLLAEARSILLVALRAVGLVERADDEVCDKGICAVFLNVERRVGRWVDVCHCLKEILQRARRRCKGREQREKIFPCKRNSLDGCLPAPNPTFSTLIVDKPYSVHPDGRVHAIARNRSGCRPRSCLPRVDGRPR